MKLYCSLCALSRTTTVAVCIHDGESLCVVHFVKRTGINPTAGHQPKPLFEEDKPMHRVRGMPR